jgi:methylmalonyl-CoA mutase cobalamin-binding subunit
VNILANLVLLVGVLGLDQEGVGTKVVALALEKVGWEVLGAVTVEPEIMLVDV